jgi:hypothetical protein
VGLDKLKFVCYSTIISRSVTEYDTIRLGWTGPVSRNRPADNGFQSRGRIIMHHSWEDVLEVAVVKPNDHTGWSYATIKLGERDTTVNPASTKRLIYGPCTVKYAIHKTGIDTTILP